MTAAEQTATDQPTTEVPPAGLAALDTPPNGAATAPKAPTASKAPTAPKSPATGAGDAGDTDSTDAAESTDGADAADGTENDGDAPAKGKRGRPKGSTARKTRSVELILTVSGGADGDWQADLKHGTDRVVQGLSIPAAAVSRAARELHPEISGGIETVLDEARAQHRHRLEQLEAEVNKVKQALAELEDEAG